uniref:Uncharacterized protein n=1 Tax=Octopus bimaculoides TaxID=37653 RepID=A0A0L8GY45_OCTBM
MVGKQTLLYNHSINNYPSNLQLKLCPIKTSESSIDNCLDNHCIHLSLRLTSLRNMEMK